MTSRLFIAVALPEEHVGALRSSMEKARLPGRLTAASNIHLTLVFLGDVQDEKIFHVRELCRDAAKETSAFVLCFDRVSLGPPHGSARMVWANYDGGDEWRALVGRLHQILKKAAPNMDKKESIPHATLVRFGQILTSKTMKLPAPVLSSPSFKVTSFELIKSMLHAQGAEYTVIESFALSSP